MKILQADLYKLPSQNSQGFWQLLICDRNGSILLDTTCPQNAVNAEGLATQLQQLDTLPQSLQVFRPDCLGLFQTAGQKLNIAVEATRRTPTLKEILQQRGVNIAIAQPPPQPLPDALWGEQWRFVSLRAGDLFEAFREQPIPILNLPEDLNPVNFGLASNIPIPGIMIYGGRQSMPLARWVLDQKPYAVYYIPTEAEKSGGLVLETGLCDRWIFVTFEDPTVAKAATTYQQRLQTSQGLHFLVIVPDETGVTTTAVWLLQKID